MFETSGIWRAKTAAACEWSGSMTIMCRCASAACVTYATPTISSGANTLIDLKYGLVTPWNCHAEKNSRQEHQEKDRHQEKMGGTRENGLDVSPGRSVYERCGNDCQILSFKKGVAE